MELDIYSKDYDDVINSMVITGRTTYGFAVDKIYPLINRFSAQRKLQNPSFYDRLKKDIISGCLMPPITLALVDNSDLNSLSLGDIKIFVNERIESGYVLDGMQRLNVLNLVKDEEGFNRDKTLFINLVVSSKRDMLLYRMITLNNGQRPMTPRHQIEVLTEELFNFDALEIDIQSEKERAEKIKRGAFNLADVAKGYLAFFTGHVHNENNKIISEKMDEIIVGRIMNTGVVDNGLEFQQVLELIDKYSSDDDAKAWLKVQNNLIGFCVGVKASYKMLNEISAEEFGSIAVKFDHAFKGVNAAKVNLGKYRRELSRKYIERVGEFKNYDELQLLDYFSEETAQ